MAIDACCTRVKGHIAHVAATTNDATDGAENDTRSINRDSTRHAAPMKNQCQSVIRES